jgi:V/A-type H+-transporting ATPase subunit I
MAIVQMTKVIIVSHRTQASELLEALQREGICQILNAQEAIISKNLPELAAAVDSTSSPQVEKPRDIQQFLEQLGESIAFLKNYAESPKGLAAVLSPRTVIDEQAYKQVVSSSEIPQVIEQCRKCEAAIEKLKTEREELLGTLEQLRPWVSLETPVEEIGRLRQVTALTGLIKIRQIEPLEQQLSELGAAIELVGTSENRYACVIVCLNQNLNDLQKLLRSADFEAVGFEGMTGTAAELLEQNGEKLEEVENQLKTKQNKAVSLSKNLLKLQILHDHYENLLNREQTKGAAPATEHTILLEGWVKKDDYARLEKIVSHFDASSLSRIKPAEGEEIPVEIENKNYIRPFEMITRLYGMPVSSGIDPTACLAPFFMLFFGICLADVGYGLVMAAVMLWLIRKTQGDKKPLWMFLICAAVAIPAGAVTGSWFGDAVPTFIPVLNPIREKLMLFDPLGEPTILFELAVILGYTQIMTGLAIAFAHNLRQKSYIAAICDNLTWLVMLNCIVIFGLSKAGMAPAELGRFLGLLAIVPAATILLFSQRQGRWAGRIGMGAYNLFSAVFYLGDVLSYLRLAALCMVGGGIAMAINIIAKISLDIPYGLGVLAMILVLVFGHALNLVLSALGAFVHTLRLQYVEYFTKFFVGGGRLFEPLRKDYKHIYIK